MDRHLDTRRESPALPLPRLRQDLSLLPGPDDHRGSPRYLIHDPITGRFHRIGETIAKVLSHWSDQTVADFASELIRRNVYATPSDATDGLKALLRFLDRNRLLETSHAQQTAHLAESDIGRRRPWHEVILHKYLYIRIPLFRPQAWLDRILPWLEPWFRPHTAIAIALMGLVGLYLAGRQWDDFVSTFLYFFTPGGLVFYGLTLLIIKSLHELGHAIMARRAGAAVPVIGVAFLVMFPILYTDTTDAWRLRDRRQRVLIDAGGILVELIIACLAIFAWSLLPDGPLRSAAFFAATTSWTMSLLVNLNPCMRFDGYYLLSDGLGIENLQQRGFALGRWQMRRTLLGLTAPKPEETRPTLLCLYAYGTWVYRFFLFIGIALLIHHIFPKAIGIVLFCAEIGIFILRPILRELTHWWGHRMTILKNRRGQISVLILLIAFTSLFIPWQTRIITPALMRPAEQTWIYGQDNARIDQVFIRHGQSVEKGDVLLRLYSDVLQHEYELAQRSLALAELKLSRQAANAIERQDITLRHDQVSEARSRVESLQRQISALTIRAPFSGSVGSLHPNLETGLRTMQQTVLFRLRTGNRTGCPGQHQRSVPPSIRSAYAFHLRYNGPPNRSVHSTAHGTCCENPN